MSKGCDKQCLEKKYSNVKSLKGDNEIHIFGPTSDKLKKWLTPIEE